MFKNTPAFSSFSVDDLDVAKRFYEDKLGIKAEDGPMGITLKPLGIDNGIFVYSKPNHVPATFTVLNFAVKDVEETVDELTSKGIVFERYEGMTDAKGIAHPESPDQGPEIAWFKDPAGNVISVMQRL